MATRVPTKGAAELVSGKGYTYLDVRTPEEFSAGRPAGSVNIPLMLRTPEGMVQNTEFMQKVKETFADPDAPLVVGCKSGNRSARACAMLSTEGFSTLADNSTGFGGWVADGLSVEK